MSDLLELAARCEAAVGQDDLLDAEIMVAIKSETFFTARVYMVGTRAMSGAGPDADWRNATVFFKETRFTASIDAAMTLVGGNFWRVEDHELAGPCALVGDQEGYAATPALALCAAALRARTSLPTAAPAGKTSSSPASLHSLGTGAAEATGGGE